MIKILVIEDDPGVQFIFSKILTLLNYSVCQASNGIEGLLKLTPDIKAVICDIHMPKMDGFEFLKKFKGTSFWKKIPFIFISGYIPDSQEELDQMEGVDCFLKKPLDIEIFGITFLALLKRYHLVGNLGQNRTE